MTKMSLLLLIAPMFSIFLWINSILIFTQTSPKYSLKSSIRDIKYLLTANYPLFSSLLWNLSSPPFSYFSSLRSSLGSSFGRFHCSNPR